MRILIAVLALAVQPVHAACTQASFDRSSCELMEAQTAGFCGRRPLERRFEAKLRKARRGVIVAKLDFERGRDTQVNAALARADVQLAAVLALADTALRKDQIDSACRATIGDVIGALRGTVATLGGAPAPTTTTSLPAGGTTTTTTATHPAETTTTTIPSSVNGCDPARAVDLTGQSAVTITFAGSPTFTYTPACFRVRAGTAVTFKGSFAFHPLVGGTVTSGATLPDPASPIRTTSSGTSAAFTVSAPGTYPFYCDFHALSLGMKGAASVVP